eukprot:CAMPEP_0203924358 /NCGR_PEP_ID=MMETSP0359-20131031/64114_1 /ASSEMBLY_ACC=CAM_ASM_000338 /TAXON_ID=268821 /ORGANISM="Scrippsiella Hangoei, Strain SHTV-5" /LENGTH=38 /DNA_ID= /DNA_START= /DNA_END= /DNA_ORIENTATION=
MMDSRIVSIPDGPSLNSTEVKSNPGHSPEEAILLADVL